MNKIVWLVPAFIIFCLFSCSNPQGIVLTSQEDTLRNEVELKSEQMIWSTEIEPEKLSYEINDKATASQKEFITPQMLSSIKELQPAVYPEIKDFASLDYTAMNSSLISVINDFCEQLCKGTDDLQSFFYSKYFFNYVFFKNDFEPIVKQFKKDDVLFDRFLICKAFESQDLSQVPVRFYNNKDFVDLYVYLTYHSGYKVTQIEVIRWGKINGESEQKDSN